MKKRGPITIALFAVVIIGAIAMSIDVPGGPSHEWEGVVKGTVADAREGPPTQFATIALVGVGEVRAAVSSPLVVRTGQTVRVREHRRIFTGAKTYEVVAAKNGK